jgi:hypothetical protein
MTDEVKAEEVFTQLNATKILVAILEQIEKITVPTNLILLAGEEDREIQVDYNSDDQTFTFAIRKNNESGFDNDQLIESFE